MSDNLKGPHELYRINEKGRPGRFRCCLCGYEGPVTSEPCPEHDGTQAQYDAGILDAIRGENDGK